MDTERVMKYFPTIEDDPILVFKKIYGDEAYNKAGTFPGAFEIGEDFNHYRTIFESKMGEDILKVKDKKYVGDGKLLLTESEEIRTPTPDDDDIPFAEGGIADIRPGFVKGTKVGKRIVEEIVEYITSKFTPMDAMKEVNKVIGKTGKYKNLKLTQKDIDEIVEGSNDFIFQRDPDNLFVEGSIKDRTEYLDDADKAETFFPKTSINKSVDDMSIEESLTTLEGLGGTKMAERFKLKQKYPGITDDLVGKILIDDNPQRKAELLATLDEAFRMMEKGKGPDEVVEIFKNTTRTKNAKGGRAGYYGGGQAMVEPDLSDIGHGSDALMARTRMTAPGSQATTSTGLNYLLGEDNETVRVPYKEKGSVTLADLIKVNASGTKSGKNQIMGAPEGITADSETFNAIIKMDIPLSKKIDLLGSYGYGKDRFKVEKGNKELFLGEGGYKDRNIGIGVNQGGEGLSGSVIRNLETGDNDYQLKFLKKFAEGGRIGYNEGLLVPPAKPYTPDMFEKDSMTLLQGMYGTGKDSNEFLYNEMIKKGNILRNQGVERETVIEIIRNNKDKINAFLETQTGDKKTLKGLADGGITSLRQGYVGGGGVNLARRGFLKVLGGTVGAIAAFKSGALKLLGKTATTKVAPKLFTAAEGSGAPAWFEGMVNKVLADGVDITKKAATMDGQVVKSLDTPTGKVDVTIDRTGNIDVNYMGDNTAMGEGVDMRYVVGQADEGTKGVKPFDEFEAVETIPQIRQK